MTIARSPAQASRRGRVVRELERQMRLPSEEAAWSPRDEELSA
jgi:hypothetical protein